MMTWIPHAGEFSTVEVANILEVNRLNFYEWTCRKYIIPIKVAKCRGNAAVFDMKGLMAAAIFSQLNKNIRRPIVGKISSWYQEHGHLIPGGILYCAIKGADITMYDEPTVNISNSDYVIVIPIGSIRQRIETRIKEIHCHGQPEDHPGGD